MPTGKVQSFADGLTEIQSTLGRMRMAPDADQPFIEDLTKVITAKAQEGQQRQQQAQQNMQQQLQQSLGGGGMGAPAAGGGPPPPNAGPGGGGPPNPNTQGGPNQINPQQMAGQGMQARPDMPNPDELRRFLQSQAGG